MRRLVAVLFLAASLMAATAQAVTDLQRITGTADDLPLDFAPWFGKTLAVTSGGLRLVDWNFAPGERREDLLLRPLAGARLIAFGDSLFVYRPQFDGLLVRRDSDGNTQALTREPGWHLASNRIGGLEYFVELGQEGLEIYPAPGVFASVGAIDFAPAVLPWDQAVTDGDRAAVARRFGGETLIQIIDLSDPTAPVAGQVTTHDETAWIALLGHTLVVAGTLVRSYDVADPDAPVLLNELGPAGEHRRPSFRQDGVLAVWRDRDIRLVDASDPSDLRPGATLPAVLPVGEEPWPLRLEEDRLVTLGEHGLHAYDLPAAHYVLLDDGVGWWRREGSLLVTDGRYAYLQGERRYVLDLHGPGRRIAMLGAVDSPPPGTGAFLGLVADHLIYADGTGDVVIEDVSEPLLPAQVAVIDLPTQVRQASLDAPYLALVRTGIVDLYDLSNPAVPQHAGDITAIAHPTRALVHDDLAFVVEHVNGIDDRIHIVDLSIPGSPPVVAVHDLAGDGWLHRVMQMTARGQDLLAQVSRSQDGEVEIYTLRLDLSDPADPVAEVFDELHYFWGDWSQPPVEIMGYHVTVEVGSLYLNDYQGDPVSMPVLDILTLPSRIGAVAVSGNELVALYDRSLACCTVSVDPPVAAPATIAIDPTVRAVPNPFNPRTTVAFAMAQAGAATVEVFDLRGRRVRSLRGEWPTGPARVIWEGDDDGGRALPSGTYLLRVTTPTEVTRGRCQLIR